MTDWGRRYPAVRLVAVLVAMNTIAYLDRSILTLAAPQLRHCMGLSLDRALESIPMSPARPGGLSLIQNTPLDPFVLQVAVMVSPAGVI